MQEQFINQVKSLSRSEKASLADYLLMSLAQDSNYELSAEQKKELEEDYKEYLANPNEGVSWEEAKQEILNGRS